MKGRGTLLMNISKGVLDDGLSERIDLEHYYRAIRKGRNIICAPQGGGHRRDGGRHQGRLRRELRAVPLANTAQNPITVTAVNGGTAANLTDQDVATKLTSTAGPTTAGGDWVLWQIDLGLARTIAAVDLIDYSAATGTGEQCVYVQSSIDGAIWTDFGLGQDLKTTLLSRRYALAPGNAVTARYWRMSVRTTVTFGAVSIGTVQMWTEVPGALAAKRLSFAKSKTDTYVLWATDRNIDVYRAGVWKAAVAIEHRASQLSKLTQAQSFDTIIPWHDEVRPPQIQRQGSDTEWDFRAIPFTNIPNQPATTAALANRDSIQRVTLTNIADTDLFVMSVEGLVTQPVAKSQDVVAMAAAIQAAIEALPNVATGLSVEIIAASPTLLDFGVSFTGAGNAGRYWARLWADVPFNAAATSVTTILQDGQLVGTTTDLFGPSAGWPRCGAIFQQRLWVGGLHQFPQTAIASVTSQLFNLDSSGTAATRAIVSTLDTDQVVTIQHIIGGRHLIILTDVSEWYVPDRIIDGTTAISFVETTTYGSAQEIAPATVDGGVFYVQPSGTVIRDMLWDEGQQDYAAGALSLLSTDVIGELIDLDYRTSSERTEGATVLGVTAAGTIACLVFMRGENVIAFTDHAHGDGLFRNVSVDEGDRSISVVVERTVSGVTDLYFERWTDSTYLDAAIERPVVAKVVTGLGHLEGKTVWAYADRDPVGPFVVAGAQITLPRDATTAVVGVDHGISVMPMPIKSKLPDGTVLRDRKRIHTAAVVVKNTGAFAIRANGGPVNVARLPNGFGAVLGVPLLDRLFSGEVVFSHLLGTTRDGDFEILQPTPGPFQMKSLMLEVA